MVTSCDIDGNSFSTLEGFFEEVSRVMVPGASWGHNLDAFNDILRGGFGTPADGFVIRWKNHAVSKERLGYSETVRQLGLRLQRCHPSNRVYVAADLAEARVGRGATVYDWLVAIIRDHGRGGQQQEDGVTLVLE
jgi:RNAse (barnase) inhibitor barstar